MSRRATSEHWKEPEGGDHGVAIRSDVYEALKDDVDNFFGRPVHRFSHYFSHERETYAVFTFREKRDAEAFMSAFEGEPFDLRDAGRGVHWMIWYKNRYAKRFKNRSPYDFRKNDV